MSSWHWYCSTCERAFSVLAQDGESAGDAVHRFGVAHMDEAHSAPACVEAQVGWSRTFCGGPVQQ